MRPAVRALRCRALTTGESICAVRRERTRSVSFQKPPQASLQGCQEFIGLISVGGAAIEEPTAAAAAGQTPGKTVAIAASASTSTDFPNGHSGTGRLSFRCRGYSLKQSTGLFLNHSRGFETRSLLWDSLCYAPDPTGENIAARFLMNRAAYIMLFLKDYWYQHRDRNLFSILDCRNPSIAG